MQIIRVDEKRLKNRMDVFSKKHGDEVVSTLSNLTKALEFWEESSLALLRTSGLVRRETSGILAVDQKGSKVKPPYLLRLYFFCVDDEEGKKCYLLTLGDKRTQKSDNEWCKEKLKELSLISDRR